ncbi:hypothetical protein RFI_06173, partial [Reticulomyxa filosa]
NKTQRSNMIVMNTATPQLQLLQQTMQRSSSATENVQERHHTTRRCTQRNADVDKEEEKEEEQEKEKEREEMFPTVNDKDLLELLTTLSTASPSVANSMTGEDDVSTIGVVSVKHETRMMSCRTPHNQMSKDDNANNDKENANDRQCTIAKIQKKRKLKPSRSFSTLLEGMQSSKSCQETVKKE